MAGKGGHFGFYTFWWELVVLCFCLHEMSEGMNIFLCTGHILSEDGHATYNIDNVRRVQKWMVLVGRGLLCHQSPSRLWVISHVRF